MVSMLSAMGARGRSNEACVRCVHIWRFRMEEHGSVQEACQRSCSRAQTGQRGAGFQKRWRQRDQAQSLHRDGTLCV